MSYNAWENDCRLPDISFAQKIRETLGDDTRFLSPTFQEFKEKCFSMREIAKLLSINYHTLQAWAGKYKLISPHYSENGQRAYFKESELKQIVDLYEKRVIEIYGPKGRIAVQRYSR